MELMLPCSEVHPLVAVDIDPVVEPRGRGGDRHGKLERFDASRLRVRPDECLRAVRRVEVDLARRPGRPDDDAPSTREVGLKDAGQQIRGAVEVYDLRAG